MHTRKVVFNNKPKNQFSYLAPEDDDEDSNEESKDFNKESKDCNKKVEKLEEEEVKDEVENNIFKNYYSDKRNNFSNKKFNYYKNQNFVPRAGSAQELEDKNDDFTVVGSVRKEKVLTELTILDVPENILELNMLNYYRVLAHHNEDKNWDLNSYMNICTLVNWGDVSRLFNTLNISTERNKITDFDIFIMKNDISPLWEDEENRNGSICSFKIDSLIQGYEILKLIFYHVCNNTLMSFNHKYWNNINGVSFSPKKMDTLATRDNDNDDDLHCVIIKIWYKNNYSILGNIEKYFNPEIGAVLRKYSTKTKAIKPEY